jgi:lipopolysaccharide export LptBFGC system permease protein LptF
MVDRTLNTQQNYRVLVLPVFCCVYSVLSTIIFPFFPGHRVLCCSVFCCVYSVLSTIIFLFFLGHRVLVLGQHQNTITRKEGENNGGQNTI